MKKFLLTFLAVTTALACLTACTPKTNAQDDMEQAKETSAVELDESKKAILVVSFGTSYEDTREKTIGATEKAIAEAFPDYEIRRAFTSGTIIKKLAERDNIIIDTVGEALEKLKNEGFGTVICQPTHIMPGKEYDELCSACKGFEEIFPSFAIGSPLINSFDTYEEACLAFMSDKELGEDEAIIAMGHGTHHFANAIYSALGYTFKDLGMTNVFVTTVEGVPSFEQTLKELSSNEKIKKVKLYPFMIVAGDHANNDMAGDEEDSLKTVLKKAGYEVEANLVGLGENEAMRQLFVKNVEDAIASLEK